MEEIRLELSEWGHGGKAIGRDEEGRAIFVPFAIPGERVEVEIVQDKGRYAHGQLKKVEIASWNRTRPRCIHYTVCGGCYFQHMDYELQLRLKQEVVIDQLERIGQIFDTKVHLLIPHPRPWAYGNEISLSPCEGTGVGLWSPTEQRVIPISQCPILDPELQSLLEDIDLELPNLRRMNLRIGSDQSLLVTIETDGAEAPELMIDFPASVALVLPDRTAVNLVGDNYLLQTIGGHSFQVSAGCDQLPTEDIGSLLVEQILKYAKLSTGQLVLDLYSGVGMISYFLAERAQGVIGIESNPDAISDAAANLDAFDNIELYEGYVEDILPSLNVQPDLIVFEPPSAGLAPEVIDFLGKVDNAHLIYVSRDPATMARDGKRLTRHGYQIIEVQPIDLHPQTAVICTVSVWKK